MKNIFISLLLVILISGFNISKAKDFSDQKTWRIGSHLSPDYCFRRLTLNENYPFNSFNNEIRKLGFTGAFNALYNYNSLVSFETGLWFSNRGYRTEEFFIKYPNQGSSPDPSSVVLSTYSISNFNYLDIPLKINFNWNLEKIRLFVSTGFLANILINSNINKIDSYIERIERSRSSYPEKIKTFNTSVLLGLGAEIPIKEFMFLRIEPMFRYALLDIYAEKEEFSKNLYTIGLNMGLMFKINQ